jgi:hypothetical protein
MKALALVRLAACTNIGPTRGSQTEVTALAQAIRAMSHTVDPAEATRAAQVSYAYTHQLAQQYQITDAPLIHSAKVNAVLRLRGLCYRWAEDMERRLNAEAFTTL